MTLTSNGLFRVSYTGNMRIKRDIAREINLALADAAVDWITKNIREGNGADGEPLPAPTKKTIKTKMKAGVGTRPLIWSNALHNAIIARASHTNGMVRILADRTKRQRNKSSVMPGQLPRNVVADMLQDAGYNIMDIPFDDPAIYTWIKRRAESHFGRPFWRVVKGMQLEVK